MKLYKFYNFFFFLANSEKRIEEYLKSQNGGEFPFSIKHETAKEAQKLLTNESNKDARGFLYNLEFMKVLINLGKKFSKPGISQFYVSCIGQTEAENLIFGVNLEFPPLPLYSCVHAEQSLISSIITYKELSLKKIYLSHGKKKNKVKNK